MVQGVLRADTVWEGDVEVAGDLQVPAGRTLRLLPGTRVRVRPAEATRTEPEFVDNATELLVRGRLSVEGTAGRPVVIEPAGPPEEGPFAWGGIIFDRGGGEIRHLRLSGAEAGLTLIGASPRIADTQLDGIRHGVLAGEGAAPVLERVRIRAEEGGISCWPGSAPRLTEVSAEASEHEGLLVAPGAFPAIRASRFAGPVAGVLWGAAQDPPEGELGGATLRRVPPRQDDVPGAGDIAPLAPPGAGRPGPPTRVYRGESFIGEDVTWEGEILVEGTVMVSPAAHLVIAPGTAVRFAFRDTDGDGIGENELFVQGRISAAGTPERPVVFAAAGAPGPGRWGAINLMGSDVGENLFSHCLIESSYRGLHSHFSRFRAEDCLFRGNYRALQFQESTAAISRCTVTGNASGMRFRDSTVAVEDSRVARNLAGVQILRSRFSLLRTRIEDNALAGLHVRESEGGIAGCEIARSTPGVRGSESRLDLEDDRIVGNNLGGLLLRRSEVRISGGRIAGNFGNGLSLDSPGARVRRSRIEGNLRFAVENNSPAAVDAAENWWGEPGPPPPGDIYDRADDPRVGPVLAEPSLAGPP